MKDPTILILGGYGEAGRQIARLLLQESAVRLILAGRNFAKAGALARDLNNSIPGKRVSALQLDAADQSALEKAFAQIQMVVVASSTSRYTRQVAQAALNSRIDYLDIQYSSAKLQALQSLAEQIRQQNLCFISEGGFHPGLPAAMVRYLALEFDHLETAHIGSVIKINWKQLTLSQATLEEFVLEMREFQPVVFTNGAWHRNWKNRRTFDFGQVFGKQKGTAMLLEEMKLLPETYPTLKETGFYVGGFNWFVDNVLMIPSMLVLSLGYQRFKRPVSRLLHWGLIKFCQPPFGTRLLLQATGWKENHFIIRHLKIEHEDGYVLTALPVVACLLQYLDGTIRKPGLWTQGNVVEPLRFFKDLRRLGVQVELW